MSAEIDASGMSDVDGLIDRLEDASDALMDLSQRPLNTRYEQQRLLDKREGVLLALSYARESRRTP